MDFLRLQYFPQLFFSVLSSFDILLCFVQGIKFFEPEVTNCLLTFCIWSQHFLESLTWNLNYFLIYFVCVIKHVLLSNYVSLVDWWKQIKGDSPEKVEYIGIRNLINAVKGSVGLQDGKLLFGFEGTLFCMLKPLISILSAVLYLVQLFLYK